MALIAIGADKGAPGVTTTALALAAVWPRPVLLAECDPAGGDLVYRLPAADGGRLDPRRGVLSLAVAARRGMQSNQVWDQTQKLHGGLDVLTGVTNAEQGAGLNLLWGPVGKMLAGLPHADVIADCGRIGVDGPHYDLLAEATLVVLITRPVLGEIIRLRDRVAAVAAAASKRGRRGFVVDVVVVADQKRFKITLGEVAHALGQGNVPARIVGALADEPKSAEMLCGEWGGRLDKTLLMRTARDIAQRLAESLPGEPNRGSPRQARRAVGMPDTSQDRSRTQDPRRHIRRRRSPPRRPSTRTRQPCSRMSRRRRRSSRRCHRSRRRCHRSPRRRLSCRAGPGPHRFQTARSRMRRGPHPRYRSRHCRPGQRPRRRRASVIWAGTTRRLVPSQSHLSRRRPQSHPAGSHQTVSHPTGIGSGDGRWTTVLSSGCAARSATGWPSSAGWTPRPACPRCRGRTSGSSLVP